ncbi:hypothetical protein IWX47DRAFT_678217 [Phyllosticta citricarpa]|uniref:Uncharacterized protein n=1 Tax=Phyllosticta citricarpa TaxID=55181 RepID=A0ABR1L6U5_9PEZI
MDEVPGVAAVCYCIRRSEADENFTEGIYPYLVQDMCAPKVLTCLYVHNCGRISQNALGRTVRPCEVSVERLLHTLRQIRRCQMLRSKLLVDRKVYLVDLSVRKPKLCNGANLAIPSITLPLHVPERPERPIVHRKSLTGPSSLLEGFCPSARSNSDLSCRPLTPVPMMDEFSQCSIFFLHETETAPNFAGGRGSSSSLAVILRP